MTMERLGGEGACTYIFSQDRSVIMATELESDLFQQTLNDGLFFDL